MTGAPSSKSDSSSRLSVKAALDIIRRRSPSGSNRESLAISESDSFETTDSPQSPVKRQRSSSSLRVRGIFRKLRSSSTSVPLADDGLALLHESEFKQIDDWFLGFDRYNQLVTTQVSQHQTYPSEAFTKITGILSKNCGGRFIHGLPEAVFDHALLWCPGGASGALKDSEGPSWSWTNWNGPVNFPFDPTNAPDLRKRDGVLLKSEIQHFEIGPQETSEQYTVRREKSSELHIEYPPWFHAPWGKDVGDSSLLRFRAELIPADRFTSEQIKYENKDIPCSFLRNDENKHCGVIMDFYESLSQPSAHGPFDFVLLSRSLRKEGGKEIERPTTRTIHPPGTPIWDGNHFVWHQQIVDFDENVYEEGPWKMLNVMLIQWVGEEAKRVAIGRIHEDEWKKHDPKKEDIILR